MGTGLYIHIPFCRRKCPYCDFYSVPYDDITAARYIDILTEQIRKINSIIDTVYVGGGTPTVLSVFLLEKLCAGLSNIIKRAAESTCEVNPESITNKKLAVLRRSGFNRLSIGMQSFREDKLKILGRIHSVSQAVNAVTAAREAGFTNISVDAIFGVPGEKTGQWEDELKKISLLPLTHISCYALTIERKTPFYHRRNAIDDAAAARMYRYALRFLPREGFGHYEVSNFAREGRECLHNYNCWDGHDYIGIGPGAVSLQAGVRTRNIPDISRYITMFSGGASVVFSRERLEPRSRAREYAAIKIRTTAGIDTGMFRKYTGFDAEGILKEKTLCSLAGKGLLKLYKRAGILYRIALTRKGFLYADEVSSSFL